MPLCVVAKHKLKRAASFWVPKIPKAALVIGGALVVFGNTHSTQAQDGFYEVETKYIFGFTEGSGVGLEGEKEISAETIARIGKAGGRYWASETKLEYEFTPNQYVQFELGPLVSTHVIKNVTDLENRNNLAMSGFFGWIIVENWVSWVRVTSDSGPPSRGATTSHLGRTLDLSNVKRFVRIR